MEYTMDYVDTPSDHDEVVEQDGARVLIAPMAQMFLFGTEIDYETSLLESSFKFRNPNVADACGCGESINFRISDKRSFQGRGSFEWLCLAVHQLLCGREWGWERRGLGRRIGCRLSYGGTKFGGRGLDGEIFCDYSLYYYGGFLRSHAKRQR